MLFAAREILELAGLHALQTLPSKERAATLEPFVAAIETANSNGDTDHRWLAKAIQGPEDVGVSRPKEHLAYGAAELRRLRELLAP
jgi:hypothetical protein